MRLLQRFSRAHRHQEYAKHILALAVDSWGAQLLAPHIPELRISPNMQCTTYSRSWAENPRMRYTSSGRTLGMEQTLGDRLRAVRRRLGVSQIELAEKSGVEQQSISRVERNERLYMRSDVLARLVKALGVSADELLGTEPDR